MRYQGNDVAGMIDKCSVEMSAADHRCDRKGTNYSKGIYTHINNTASTNICANALQVDTFEDSVPVMVFAPSRDDFAPTATLDAAEPLLSAELAQALHVATLPLFRRFS